MPGNRLRGRSIGGISQELLALLMFHDYPGNIRELENIIEHVFMLYREGKIEIHCLPENLRTKIHRSIGHGSIGNAVKSTEAQLILDALKHNENNWLAAARELGIHKSTLYRKIKKLVIDLGDKTRQISRKRNQ